MAAEKLFSEPALFILNPHSKGIKTFRAPFVRPEHNGVLKELKFIQEEQYSIGKCSIE